MTPIADTFATIDAMVSDDSGTNVYALIRAAFPSIGTDDHLEVQDALAYLLMKARAVAHG